MSTALVTQAFLKAIKVEITSTSSVVLLTYPDTVNDEIKAEMITYLQSVQDYQKCTFYMRQTNANGSFGTFSRLNIGLTLDIQNISDNGAGQITIFFNSQNRVVITTGDRPTVNWKNETVIKQPIILAKTPFNQLPLPNRNNSLNDDVTNITNALMAIDALLNAGGSSGSSRTFNSVSDMRAAKPTKDGETVFLNGYYANTNLGSGVFVGSLKGTTDDQGVNISDGSTFTWKRVVRDPSILTVADFGAVADGKTDCVPAITAMWNYVKSLGTPYTNIGIQFPAGEFGISTFDIAGTSSIGYFAVRGADISFGYFAKTKFNLIGADDSFAFRVNAIRSEFSNFEVYGAYDKVANTRGFFQNIRKVGQYVNTVNVRHSWYGGVQYDLVDTLDTKFDGFYSANGRHSFIRGRPSNSAEGSWYHITAVQLSNFNVQSTKGPNAALDLPHCTQSFIYNGWLEKNEFPGDFNNGQWIVDGLSLEGNTNPFNFTYTQLIIRVLNLQSGSSVLYDDPNATRSASGYDMGRRRDEHHGSEIQGSMSYKYLSSVLRLNNTSTTDSVWYNVGKSINTGMNDHTVIRFTGSNGTAVPSGTSGYADDSAVGGDAILRMRRVPISGVRQDISLEIRGKSPISDIGLKRPWENDNEIFIQLPPNSGWVNVHVETTTPNRFQAGICFQWTPNGAVLDTTTTDVSTLVRPRNYASFGTLKHGIAFDNGGNMIISTKKVLDGNKLQVNINNKNYLMPIEIAPDMSDSFRNRIGELNNTPPDNYLGGNFTNNWTTTTTGFTTSSKGLTISLAGFGSGGISLTKSDYTIDFTLVSGPTSTSETVNSAIDIRRAHAVNSADTIRFQLWGAANGTTKVRLIKRVGGTVTTIGGTDQVIKDGAVIRSVCSGSSIKIYADGALIWDIVETDCMTNNYFGFGTGTGNTGFTISNVRLYL